MYQLCIGQIEASTSPYPTHSGHLTPLPSQGGENLIILIIRVFQGVGNLNCTLDFHEKSLAWRAIMGDAVLEDFVENIVPLWPIDYQVRACFVPYLNLP